MRLSRLFLLAGALGAFAADANLEVSFRPQDLPKKVAHCKALNRATHRLKDIDIHYVDVNPEAGRTLLMVHGWPSLWHSWKYQVEEFKNDSRLIIPDLRGFGESTHPDDVKSSGTWYDIVKDLLCVLEDAGVDNAICVGHDWGTQLCYQAARQRPDIVSAVLGAAIPYIPFSGDFQPTSALVPHFPRLAYQVFLGETPELAAAELDTDVRRTLRGTLRTVASPTPETFLTSERSFMGAWADVAEIPPIPFFTSEEEDYWVEQYGIQGFDNTLYFYTPANQKRSWEFIHAQLNFTIPQPVLSILPNKASDPVADWEGTAKLMHSADYIPNLTTHIIEGAHWLQLENPTVFNRIARQWLDGLSLKETVTEEAEKTEESRKRPADEL
ncbi:alpha/beta-hydrolase [Laetiporus sulphureus 93-53]|uniref:Alpha/beta-hydrolase n=1 Tax=Laetiporus sulphureus 93-53 TaxID=1314785 RepID=A0A165IMC4_9APHY|nr:alpha/beta-hydrolase [Laetiporus sulphureus 93-53]KZT13278.1 alpha/beta-hydrolase [Laetiporus sulphureus 93-53]